MRPLSVYIHIPFCVRKCAYCDFLSFPEDQGPGEAGKLQGRYFDALLAETDAAAEKLKRDSAAAVLVRCVYFGGGTPSLSDPERIREVLTRLEERFVFSEDAEISLECNPGTASCDKLQELRRAGIGRLSIGVQSFDDTELQLLGRIHTASQAVRCFEDARAAGFDNINIDLMAALPGQTRESLLGSVRQAVSLAPEHLSLYSLIIEEGTPFYERYAGEVPDPHFDRRDPDRADTGLPHLPDEITEREMLHAAWKELAAAGYERYEISNFALRGRRCRQNLTCWERGEYLGLGLGAASLLDETRFSNTRDLHRYLEAFRGSVPAEEKTLSGGEQTEPLSRIRENTEHLSAASQMEEFMFLGLRLTEGVREERFAAAFGRSVDEVYGEVLEKHIRDGLLMRADGRIFLTDYGTDISNYVMAKFLL